MKRSRRGGRRPQNGQGGHSSSGGNGGGGNNGFNPNRVYDSNGPEVKIRGNASHVYEKYLQLARDANASGDRVMAENYLQHAEHYFRIMAVTQAQIQAQIQSQPVQPPAYQQQPQQAVAGRPVTGTEEQPFIEAPLTPVATSAPSFSLAETATAEAEDGVPEDAEAE